jgi:hypothetical protein
VDVSTGAVDAVSGSGAAETPSDALDGSGAGSGSASKLDWLQWGHTYRLKMSK